MILNIINQTASTRTYLSGTISVSGNATVTVTNTATLKDLTTDAQLRYDCINNFAQLSDGANTYANTDAWNYLDLIGRSIGGSVDSFANDHSSKQLFEDTYSSSFDTINRWSPAVTNGGGVVTTNSPGELEIGTGTTANGYSYITSQYSFQAVSPGWLQIMNAVNLEYPIISNSYRFWGFGIQANTPTTTNPITDGVGFEVSTSGKMYAISYSGGTRNVIQDLSISTGTGKQPADSAVHKYFVFFRGDITYYSIDTQDNVVASFLTGAPGPLNNTLPILMLSIAGSTPPASNAKITSNAIFVGDTNGNNLQISDGIFGWRKAGVSVNRDLFTKDIIDTTGVYGNISLSTTPILLNKSGTNLSNRKLVTLDNTLNQIIYWGYDNTVSSSNFAGRIFKDQQISWSIGSNINIYLVLASGSGTAHCSEGA